MADNVVLDNNQLQFIAATINNLKDHTPHWLDPVKSIATTVLAAMLGFGFAWFLDYLKNNRERNKTIRERREKELSSLSATNVAIIFNIETLIHTTMQQIFPHYDDSRAACLRRTTLDSY
jgi:hypothetical protein